MARTSKKIEGSKIICEYTSSNIKKAVFDLNEKTLQLTFGSGGIYEYTDVPHEVFTKFDMDDSQGKHFNTNINKKFVHKKIS